MKETWRWFGPDDPVSLDNAKQAGARGIVSALHHIYDGRAWSPDDVAARKRVIEAADLTWDVCEWIPVPSAIKLREGPYRREIDAWKDSLANLAKAGVSTVCYNFMPVVDWTRTDLRYPLPSTGFALRFDMPAFVAYDVFVLRRPGAEANYSAGALEAARARLARLDAEALAAIEKNVIGGMPARQAAYTRERFSRALGEFAELAATICAPIWSRSSRRSPPWPRSLARDWRSIPTIRRSRCSGFRASFRRRRIFARCSKPWRAPPTG